MKKVYTVHLETISNTEPKIEDDNCFWMYRGFGYDKEKAIEVAEIMASFFPYIEYDAKVVVKEADEGKDGFLTNEIVIKSIAIENEEGNLNSSEF